MQAKKKWAIAVGVMLAMVGGAWLALALLLPSDEELAVRAASELESRLGVPVTIARLHWRLLPLPAVVVEGAATRQPQAITVHKLTAYPNVGALMDGRLRLDRVDLDGAVVPQLSLRALAPGKDKAGPPAGTTPLDRFVFRDLTWVSRTGVAVVYDGEVDFDANWRPRQAQLRRPGFKPAADLELTRQGQEDRWTARIHVGGGTAHGEVQLQTGPNGRLHLDGALQPRDVEIAGALAAFNRKSIVAGRASGETSLSADGATVGELAQSLHTRTSFEVGRATLLRFDLDKAVRSLGKEHAGETPLDAITGQLDTQNTARGMVMTLSNVKATSGALSASGQARIANRRVEAEFAVDLVDGVVGVPLALSGPIDKVEVSVPRGAIAGAVLGTAVLPGVGTAIGARIGAGLGKLFGADPAPAQRQPPAPTRK